MSANVAVLTDVLGLQREYREVNRNAKVGEKVRVFGHTLPELGGIHVVRETRSSGHIHWVGGGRLPGGYVVLEKTDIVHVNGERFRVVERRATVGERVVVTKTADDYSQHYRLGEHGVVTGERGWVDEDIHVDFGGKTKYIGPSASNSEYRVLEPLTPAQQSQAPEQSDVSELERKSREQQAQIDGLTETIANLARRLSKAELTLLNVGLDVGLIEDGVSEELRKLTERVAELERGQAPKEENKPVVSKMSAREEIVEKAKADVAKLQTENHADNDVWFVDDGYYVSSHEVEFIINRNKRTVVALIREIDGEIDKKGVAKCAPNDCFNVHIGMAIALRRALGLDIPSEYVNAPQPTEVRVGDYVEYGEYFVKVEPPCIDTELPYNYTRGTCAVGSYVARNARIIDDSRDGRYGEVYSV